MKRFLLFLLLIPFTMFPQVVDTISTGGASNMSFNPDTVILNVGQSVYFDLTFAHNAGEVSESEWLANGANLNGGFYFGFGASGIFVADSVKTYYYVRQPHAGMGMKGVIISNSPGCTDSTACNYDPTATINDGSCILPDGCTDVLACNYDSTALCDDGS